MKANSSKISFNLIIIWLFILIIVIIIMSIKNKSYTVV